MKLKIMENAKEQSLFPRDKTSNFTEDKAQCYDLNRLQQWEKRYKKILILLNGVKNQEGMKLLFVLAEEGYPDARWLLSDMYLKGQGLPESFDKAVEWDRRAQYAERLFLEKGMSSSN